MQHNIRALTVALNSIREGFDDARELPSSYFLDVDNTEALNPYDLLNYSPINANYLDGYAYNISPKTTFDSYYNQNNLSDIVNEDYVYYGQTGTKYSDAMDQFFYLSNELNYCTFLNHDLGVSFDVTTYYTVTTKDYVNGSIVTSVESNTTTETVSSLSSVMMFNIYKRYELIDNYGWLNTYKTEYYTEVSINKSSDYINLIESFTFIHGYQYSEYDVYLNGDNLPFEVNLTYDSDTYDLDSTITGIIPTDSEPTTFDSDYQKTQQYWTPYIRYVIKYKDFTKDTLMALYNS